MSQPILPLPKIPSAQDLSVTDVAARLRQRLPRLMNEWAAARAPLLRPAENEVRFLEQFGLRRLPDGRIMAFEATDVGAARQFAHLSLGRLAAWVADCANIQVQLVYLDALNRETGGAFTLTDLRREEWRVFAEEADRLLRAEDATGIRPGDIVAALERLLDPEALRLLRRATGRALTLQQYNCVATDLAGWQELEKKARNFLPLALALAGRGRFAPGDGMLAALKREVLAADYPERAWKMLARMPLTLLRPVFDEYGVQTALDDALHWADAGGVPCRRLSGDSLAHRAGSPWRRLVIPAWFDSAAMAEMRVRGTKTADAGFHEEYVLALDWLRDWLETDRVPDAHQKAGGWGWIRRQSARWHAMQARGRQKNHFTWQSALAAYAEEGFEIVPLTSSEALAIDGQMLRHCVASYDSLCNAGYSRIFSIRQDGRRLSTAEIVRDGTCSWVLHQNRGLQNARPEAAVAAVAERIPARYEIAEREAARRSA